jgi:hypothetical protein
MDAVMGECDARPPNLPHCEHYLWIVFMVIRSVKNYLKISVR